jgi:K+-sensing histidine kinase KdpD
VSTESPHTSQEERNPPGSARFYDRIDETVLSQDQLNEKFSRFQRFLNAVRNLNAIVLRLDESLDREQLLETLREEMRHMISADFSFVALKGTSRSYYTIVPCSDIGEDPRMKETLYKMEEGIAGWVIDHRSPFRGELQDCPSVHPQIEGDPFFGVRYLLAVPLQTTSDTVGALVNCSALAPYSDDDLLLAQLLAQHVAIAMKNLTLMDGAQKRIDQIELVNEIAGKLTSTLDLDQLLASAARTIREARKYFDVTIFMVDHATDELNLVAHAGNYADFLPHGYRQRTSDGIVGWAAHHGERVLANDVSQDDRYLAYEYHSTRSELAVPIKVDGEVVGVLNVEDTKLGAFDDTDAIVLETLCDQLGSAMKNARLYDQVKKSNETLTELDRMKSDFLGIVSHDFRSPLASIVMAAKAILRRGPGMDEKRVNEYLNIVIDQASKLSHLAEDTLLVAMIDQTKLSYNFKVVNVERLIKDAIALVDFSRRHTVEYRVDDSVAYIEADQRRLRQVIQNILSNAVKYSPKGGVVRATAEPYGLDQVLISISDEGIGIPSDQLSKLFKKYSRVDCADARDIPGVGLGLWICEAIVKDHGGRIWVDSEPGRGSTFRIALRTVQERS